MLDYSELKIKDYEVYQSIKDEYLRQQNNIELIASENFVSQEVMMAMGSMLTNKYAEGYPGRRYYGGCQHVDVSENLAIERAKQIFGAEHVNVQPHSGCNANLAVYYAMLKPGDTILGMNLAHGGHLSHGSRVSISGKYFNAVGYNVTEDTQLIDYDALEKQALEIKPQMIVAGASAYSRIIDFKRMKEISDKVGCYLMVDIAHIAGLVAANLHPSPVPYADFVTTTTHKTLRGPRGGMIMCKEEFAKAIDKAVFPGLQGGPLMHVIAAKAVSFGECLKPEFASYQQQIVKNAKAMSEVFASSGVNMVSGGTDNHLILIDLRSSGVSGKELETMLDEVNITVNKNSIPFDPQGPTVTSGIRIGTPSITTRGFDEKACATVAKLIVRIIKEKEACFSEVKKKVEVLTLAHPLYVDIKF